MDVIAVIKDKTLKGKAKAETLSKAILSGKLKINDLIKASALLKKADKGACLEALEFVTRANPELGDHKVFACAVSNLQDEAPRVRWESAKVIGNIAAHHKTKLSDAIAGLLENTEDQGTVVRWSAAFALGNIILLNTKHNTGLIPAIESILKREENNAIRKMYMGTLKKVKKI